jgi:hypothetical protein
VRVHAELHSALRRARQLELENRLLRAEGMPEFVAGAPSMQPVLELIAQVGPSDANVLITGEHGTGKEIVAKLLHSASPRARMALVAVNAGGLPEGTFESEIFGHVKGAFTDARTDRIGRFELANGGTLFLDEIANVPCASRPSCCACLRPANWSASALRKPGAWMCACFPLPMRCSRRGQGRQLPRGPAVPHQHGRNPLARAARAARGHSAAGRAFSQSQPHSLSQAGERFSSAPCST